MYSSSPTPFRICSADTARLLLASGVKPLMFIQEVKGCLCMHEPVTGFLPPIVRKTRIVCSCLVLAGIMMALLVGEFIRDSQPLQEESGGRPEAGRRVLSYNPLDTVTLYEHSP